MLHLKNALQAVGIVVGSWLLLSATGYIAGVLPGLAGPFGQLVGDTAFEIEEDDEKDDSKKKEDSAGQNDVQPVGKPEPKQEGAKDDSKKEGAEKIAVTRFHVCDQLNSLLAADLFGDTILELTAGCGPELRVLSAGTNSEGKPRPQHIATFRRASATASEVATALSVADMTGDSHKDLALSFRELDTAGRATSGALYLVPGSETGATGTPLILGNTSAHIGISQDVVGDSTADLVVAAEGNQAGRASHEIWVFEGGASPQRRARLAVDSRVTGLVSVDVDADGHMDIVAAGSNGEIRTYYGDGKGFPKSESLKLVGLNHLTLMPSSTEGHSQAVASADGGMFAINKRTEADGVVLSAKRIVESKEKVSVRAFYDVTGNGHVDLISRSFQGDISSLKLFEASDESKYVEQPWITLAGASVGDFAVGSFDEVIGADVYVQAKVKGVADGSETRELLFIGMPPSDRKKAAAKVVLDKGVVEVAEAPLTLNVLLR